MIVLFSQLLEYIGAMSKIENWPGTKYPDYWEFKVNINNSSEYITFGTQKTTGTSEYANQVKNGIIKHNHIIWAWGPDSWKKSTQRRAWMGNWHITKNIEVYEQYKNLTFYIYDKELIEKFTNWQEIQ